MTRPFAIALPCCPEPHHTGGGRFARADLAMTMKTAQHPVEMILVRQLASYLFVPVLVFDTTGTVVFYTEPAGRILGVRFEETRRIDREEADRLVELSDDPGAGPEDSERPLDVKSHEVRCR